MSTAIFDKDQILELCNIDAVIINKALEISHELGEFVIDDTINNFVRLLIKKKGSLIPNLDLDYRAYIVGLLNEATQQSTSEENKALICRQIIMPHSNN